MIRKRVGNWKTVALGLAVVAVAATASSRPSGRTRTTTGLFSLMPNHAAIATLADVSETEGAEAPVVLEILDATDEVLASLNGTLRPGKPLTLRLDRGSLGDFPDGVPVRARAQIGPFYGNLHPQPMLTLELLNLDTLDAFQATVCPVAYGDDVGRDVIFNCGPCHTTVSRP